MFLDESGVNLSLSHKTHAWGPKGQRIPYKVTYGNHENFSLLPAMNVDGYLAVNIYKGGVNAATFEQFVMDEVIPKCSPFPGPNSVLIMDNAAIHHQQVN